MTDNNNYDAVADAYAHEFQDEMDRKPFDRKMLDWLIEKVGGIGPICDLGCGPGQIARYLHRQGIAACGIDLSAEMVKHAQQLNPDIPFQQGDMLSLTTVADSSYGGIAAFYSIIHIPRDRVVEALRELYRVLRPGGVLLVTFHIGQEIVHIEEFFEKQVSLDFLFFTTAEMRGYLQAAGFVWEEAIEREPYIGVEHPSRRAYLFARKET
jgi:SAM-dependent methyltransferase